MYGPLVPPVVPPEVPLPPPLLLPPLLLPPPEPVVAEFALFKEAGMEDRVFGVHAESPIESMNKNTGTFFTHPIKLGYLNLLTLPIRY